MAWRGCWSIFWSRVVCRTPTAGVKTIVQQAVLRLFMRFIDCDRALHRQIEQHDAGTIDNARTWRFTLRQLHQLLVASATEGGMSDGTDTLLTAVDYATFRQALYTSHLNSDLRALHASLDIADNHGKLERSVYCLVVHDQDDA